MRISPKQMRDLVGLVREKDLDYLSEVHQLEVDLLPKLGFNNELDELAHYYPDELTQFAGQGLRIWQYPNQFSKYLVELSRHQISSYLEIGVRHGGSFIVTVEYLSRFNPAIRAVGVDMQRCQPIRTYQGLNPDVAFWRVDSGSDEFKTRLKTFGNVDLAFIDGDHSEEGCWRDLITVREYSKMIAFHDIYNIDAPGVGRVWERLQREYASEYEFHEFTDQYESIIRVGRYSMGIGLAVAV